MILNLAVGLAAIESDAMRWRPIIAAPRGIAGARSTCVAQREASLRRGGGAWEARASGGPSGAGVGSSRGRGCKRHAGGANTKG